MSKKFEIAGGRKLQGRYPVQGNKNAALPLISAALLSRSRVRFENIPRIADVARLLEILQAMGVETTWEGRTLEVDATGFGGGLLPAELVERLRGSVLLLGALAPFQESISCPLPGGCPIGRRSFDVHWEVFRAAGFTVDEGPGDVHIQRDREVEYPQVYLKESSVTATENALILFAGLGQGVVENPAREPHVLDLVDFLRQLGCDIELHPLHYRIRSGVQFSGQDLTFSVPADYIDAGTVAIAAAVTEGEVDLVGVTRREFLPIRNVLEQFSVNFEDIGPDVLRVNSRRLENPSQIIAGLWPSFPTDLVSLAIVLATQGEGLCLVHDWMYEARMFFIDKLVRMGARITMCDPHRVMVEGPSRLRGTQLESPDIRAGMALVVAGLCGRGSTTIEHAEIIQRGYESVVERLSAIGAHIQES